MQDQVEHELQLSQVETHTGVCNTLDEIRTEVTRLRRAVIAAGERSGCGVASSGSHAMRLEDGNRVTPKRAYLQLEEDYQLVMREQVVCGCHVHVGISDAEAAVQVMNACRQWLPVLLALSTNSPFWQGADSGYASFRTEVWRRWPMAGPPEPFASRAEYDELVANLVAARAIDDPARIYWDVRPSARFDTLEFRVADACLTVDETVMMAGLTRALVRTAHDRWRRGKPPVSPRQELLRAATWRAARYGLDGELIDLESCRSMPSAELVGDLLRFVGPALADAGEWQEIVELVRVVQSRGTGAHRQREVFARRGRLEDVVHFVLDETAPE